MLEKWAGKYLLKLKKAICKDLPFGRDNPMHQYALGAAELESIFAEKDLRVLVDTTLNMSQKPPELQ